MDAEKMTPQECLERGKLLFFSPESRSDYRDEGLRLLNSAACRGDIEAQFIVGKLLLDGRVKLKSGDSIQRALTLLCAAADKGQPQARALLNSYCQEKYDASSPPVRDGAPAPLTDFDGQVIKIDRKGVFTPIDARLEFDGEENVLTLGVNVVIMDSGDVPDGEKFRRAVAGGILCWQGEYQVFGGQRLRVKIDLTFDDRVFDSVYIIPVTQGLGGAMTDMWGKIGTDKIKGRVDALVNDKRSMAGIGVRKWSVRSRKVIFIQSENGRFDDYEEIKHVTKHEFGHALGLGDLYSSPGDGLGGVEEGSYKELDCYCVGDRFYNLVMCDHHGQISNNDMEMVVLAFRENRMQSYQNDKLRGKISDALGRGN